MKKILFSILVTALLYGDDASTAGASLGNTVIGVIGSKSGANNRLAQPLSSTTQMTTIDGKTSFNAQIQCPASAKSVGITFLSAGGNDYRLLIQQDTNLDGTYDYTYDTATTGGTVSGVCSNGVVICTPAGSWSNCATYEWSVTNNKVTLQNVPPTDPNIGSCFCSNQSCGVGSLVSQIYDNVAGGISSAIMRSNPLYIVSKSEWSPTDMSYYLYGQDKTNCTGLGSSSWDKYGEKNPTQYYNSQTPSNTSIADVALQQGGDPNSYYSMISNQNNTSYDAKGDTLGMPNTVQCTIKKTPVENVTTIQQFTNGVAYVQSTGDYSYCNQYGTHIDTGAPGCGVAKELQIMDLIPAVFQDYSDSAVSTAESTLGYNGCTTSDGHAWGGYAIIPNGCTIHCPSGYLVSGRGGGSQACVGTFIQKSVSISINDGCSSSENTCTIQDEQVCDNSGQNCIYTIRNGAKQQTIATSSCTVGNFSTSCANGQAINNTDINGTQSVLYSGSDAWFTIKRTYNCGNSTVNLNASQMVATSNSAYKGQTATTMTYTDANGTTQTISGLQANDTCPTPVCTVKTPQTNTSQFADGTNRSQTPGGTTVYQTDMKTCTKDSTGAMTCPLDTNDTMVEACSCSGNMTGFQQAITTLGVVHDAAKDMICSQN